ARRHRGHQHRGRVCRAPPWRVDPHPVERPDLLAEDGAVLVGEAPRLRRRHRMIALDPLRRVGQGRADLGREPSLRRLELVRSDYELRRRRRGEAVEARGQLEERRVAAGAHVAQDPADRVTAATWSSPFTRSVSPDWTRSTIRSASPTSGASSTEPSSRTISTWTPRLEK